MQSLRVRLHLEGRASAGDEKFRAVTNVRVRYCMSICSLTLLSGT